MILAALSGVLFSLIAFAYRKGQPEGYHPAQIIMPACIAGVFVFGLKSFGLWSNVPSAVYVAAAVAGVTQYFLLHLIQKGLSLGPLSVVWCASMLAFVPTLVFASVTLGEQFGIPHILTLFATMGAVVMAALHSERQKKREDDPAKREHSIVAFGALLIVLIATSSIFHITMKWLASPNVDLMARFRPVFFVVFYAIIGACCALDCLVARRRVASLPGFAALGGLAAFGSVTGLMALSSCVSQPAAVVFTTNCVASIFSGALIGVFAFHEERSWMWYGVLACSLLAVVLTGTAA